MGLILDNAGPLSPISVGRFKQKAVTSVVVSQLTTVTIHPQLDDSLVIVATDENDGVMAVVELKKGNINGC